MCATVKENLILMCKHVSISTCQECNCIYFLTCSYIFRGLTFEHFEISL